MKNISFDEGYREYKLNNDESRVIRVRLSDPNLMNRINKAMIQTNELIKKYKQRPDGAKLAEFDAEIKQIINDAFGSDVCTPAFGSASVITVLPDGKLLVSAFVEAFLPVLEADLKGIAATMRMKQAEVRPEVQKYLDPVTISPVSKPIAGLAQPVAPLPDVSQYTDEQKRELLAQLI